MVTRDTHEDLNLDQMVLWLRSGGCPHTDPLEGGGLCTICSHLLADWIEVTLLGLTRIGAVMGMPLSRH
jgi:hypothetical protein